MARIDWKVGMRVKTDPDLEFGYMKIHGILVDILQMQGIKWGAIYVPDSREGYAGHRSNHPISVLVPTDEDPPGWIDPAWRRPGGSAPSVPTITGAGAHHNGEEKEQGRPEEQQGGRQGGKASEEGSEANRSTHKEARQARRPDR